MLLTVYVLALCFSGLAVVPVIKALECTTIPEYNILIDLIRHHNCNSINNMFKLLHDVTEKQHDTNCTKHAINYLADHFGHTQMPQSCHCKGHNTYVTYYDLKNQGIASNHYSCRDHDHDKSYHDLYYEFFESSNHHHGEHPPPCQTHHSLWNRLKTVSNDHDLYCLNDLIHHLSYAFVKDVNPCTCSDDTATSSTTRTMTTKLTSATQNPHVAMTTRCTIIPEYNTLMDYIQLHSCDTMYTMSTLLHDLSENQPYEECASSAIKSLADHFGGSVLVPPQCLCTGHNHYLTYYDIHGLPSNKIHCREHDPAYHDVFFDFFKSSSGDSPSQPPHCRTHHSIWTRLNAVTNNTDKHCLKDFIYHLSYAFNHQGDPCKCSDKDPVTSPTTNATKTTTTPASLAPIITTPATTTTTATAATTRATAAKSTSETTTTTASEATTIFAMTTTSETTTTTASTVITKPAMTTTRALAATSTTATEATTTATTTTTTIATTIAKTTPTSNSMTTVTTSSFGQCNHTCTLDAVILSKAVENYEAENCTGVRTTKSAPNEALPMDCCHMGNRNHWIKGAQVQPNHVCTDGTLPPYTPIAAYNENGLVPDSAGIFYGCIRNGKSGFMIVHQACDQLPQLLHVDGTTGKDPDTYYILNQKL